MNKYVVSYIPSATYSTVLPMQSTVTIPPIDSLPILLQSAQPILSTTKTYDSPMTYSTLQNLIPKLDD